MSSTAATAKSRGINQPVFLEMVLPLNIKITPEFLSRFTNDANDQPIKINDIEKWSIDSDGMIEFKLKNGETDSACIVEMMGFHELSWSINGIDSCNKRHRFLANSQCDVDRDSKLSIDDVGALVDAYDDGLSTDDDSDDDDSSDDDDDMMDQPH